VVSQSAGCYRKQPEKKLKVAEIVKDPRAIRALADLACRNSQNMIVNIR